MVYIYVHDLWDKIGRKTGFKMNEERSPRIIVSSDWNLHRGDAAVTRQAMS